MGKEVEVELHNRSVVVDSHPECFNNISISRVAEWFFEVDGVTLDALVLAIHNIKFNRDNGEFEDRGEATIAFSKEDAKHFVELLNVYIAQL